MSRRRSSLRPTSRTSPPKWAQLSRFHALSITLERERWVSYKRLSTDYISARNLLLTCLYACSQPIVCVLAPQTANALRLLGSFNKLLFERILFTMNLWPSPNGLAWAKGRSRALFIDNKNLTVKTFSYFPPTCCNILCRLGVKVLWARRTKKNFDLKTFTASDRRSLSSSEFEFLVEAKKGGWGALRKICDRRCLNNLLWAFGTKVRDEKFKD